MNDQVEETLAGTVRQRTVRVGILLFPEVEVLDFAGPFEVFSVASRIASRDRTVAHPPFSISTIATKANRTPVVARHGLTIVPSASFSDHPPLDVLIVPGGIVTQPMADADTIKWIKAVSGHALITASVCTGAFLLAKAGLLDGKKVTTHWQDIDELQTAFPNLNVLTDMPYVDEGTIVTSAGISAGIEMSLHLVARILGTPAATKTARQMQYVWSAIPQKLT